ncbi:glycosyltransferase family A protein [Nesterenkonia sandarakina]|uniref:Glycosyltransferase involved in cell wall biosynthesis n=1 Tax=Nesterenkonia sandarakina TaxID=272918 RepID=A0A2T0YSX0_9MICC|nr:glycosyltransferase family A protein [Nesterenkonia sandarakina]PRZ18872.1 glycosyltransferase involved in cell wall biosynthesis [Nesterenkonia sandarakina]
MTPQPGRTGPTLRGDRLEAGAARIAELLAAPDPLRALHENGTMALLGPTPGSPFSRGRTDASDLLDQLAPAMGALPDPEPGVSRPRLALRIAVIDDEQTQQVLRGAADVTGFPATRLRQEPSALDGVDLVILTPVSIGARYSVPPEGTVEGTEDQRQAWVKLLLTEVIPGCRRRDVPVVFWDRTTRSTTATGRDLANACDRVFAVSDEAARRYAATRRDETEVLRVPMVVNPLQNTPLGTRGASSAVITFGDAQVDQNPEDLRMMADWILDGVSALGLPAALLRRGEADTFPAGIGAGFAARHWPLLVNSPGSAAIAAIDRVTDIGIVLNDVLRSQTLYDRRIIELQAAGSLVLSGYNQGVNSYLPHVRVPQSAVDVSDALASLTLGELRRVQGDGIRTAFSNHHVSDVLAIICAAVGFSPAPPPERVLAVVEQSGRTGHQDQLDPVLSAEMASQTHAEVPLVSWDQVPARHGSYDILLPVSVERHYSPTYAADMVTAFRYQSAGIVSKLDGTAEQTDHSALRHETLSPEATETLCLDLTAWWHPAVSATASAAALRAHARGERTFFGDHLGHHARRSGASARRDRPELLVDEDRAASSALIAATADALDLQLTVIVPVYNNGDHLRHKAFASLRRSSVFEKMHVLLVNDGSTDPVTVDTVEELAHEYSNVTVYHHGGGGSGSASRPRNTGLELTHTPFVTYLDPDNEAVEDGFASLLSDLSSHEDVDFVLGDMTQWASRFGRLRYSQLLREALAEHQDASGTITVPRDALERLRFRPMGIQTVIARTEWLKGCGLEQPVGAVGQDSYFFQQMLYCARRIRVQDIGVHTYYAVVSDSTVNTINPGYFEKYRPLDAARADWLREVGKLEDYRALRLEPFFVSWMLPKLRRLESDPASWLFAAETLADILGYYGDHQWTTPAAIEFWDHLAKARRG